MYRLNNFLKIKMQFLNLLLVSQKVCSKEHLINLLGTLYSCKEVSFLLEPINRNKSMRYKLRWKGRSGGDEVQGTESKGEKRRGSESKGEE
jgi:hypothetical protein